jgi:uncharacterized membrane protein YphA (DoxX/SURF4 family)
MTTLTITPRSGRASRLLRVLGLLFVLALLAAAVVWHGLQAIDLRHVHVMIDGDEIAHGAAFTDRQPGQHLLTVMAIAAVCVALMLAVPLLLLVVALVVLPIMLLALGLPLVVVLSLGLLLLSPLVLLGLLCWWLLRALSRGDKAPPSATMSA